MQKAMICVLTLTSVAGFVLAHPVLAKPRWTCDDAWIACTKIAEQMSAIDPVAGRVYDSKCDHDAMVCRSEGYWPPTGDKLPQDHGCKDCDDKHVHHPVKPVKGKTAGNNRTANFGGTSNARGFGGTIPSGTISGAATNNAAVITPRNAPQQRQGSALSINQSGGGMATMPGPAGVASRRPQ